MDTKPTDVTAFLSRHHPFDLLPDAVLRAIAEQVVIERLPRGTVMFSPGDTVDCLYVVRTGATETHDPDGNLLARAAEGECFGVRALLRGGLAVNRVTLIEDSQIYKLSSALFDKLRAEHPGFAFFFAAFEGGRLRDSFESAKTQRPLDISMVRVGQLLRREPVCVDLSTTIRQAAVTMRDQKVSGVMVTWNGELVGMFTDRDLRSKVVAEGLSTDRPIGDVMSPTPVQVKASDYAIDAMLLMSRHNVHHLPVLDGSGHLTGCLTSTLLAESQSSSPIYLARNIHDCADAAQLAQVVARIPGLVHQMVELGARAQTVGHIVSAMTDSVTVRLLELAEKKLGPAPVPYAWLAAGSQARQEQTAQSDQDNCMILHDDYVEAEHGAYFRALAKFVCDGLDQCGYVYCPGEMMAMTDKWRQPLSVWYGYFRDWILTPEPMALMLSSVFFDMRLVHGDAALFDSLHAMVLDQSQKTNIFLAQMARNALTHEPPLGFFRNLVLIRGGEHDHTVDLKHTGTVPIIDLARVYALSRGLSQVNTYERLQAAADAGRIDERDALDLIDALEFISLTRLRHQSKMIGEGKQADNYLPITELSGFERSHLKNAFAVVKSMQQGMSQAYQLNRF